ncbi:MAG: isopeptide-forming domain-containing fimbrial protein, partial [Clostridiales bacterium]|nr:isopeptide-forming domain-containing fimbrial protein [Clostridiales bacterium]
YDSEEVEVDEDPITKTAQQDSVRVGGEIDYVITVINPSNYPVTLAEMVDELSQYVEFVEGSLVVTRGPGGYTYTVDNNTITVELPNLQPGEEATITFTVTVVAAPAGGVEEAIFSTFAGAVELVDILVKEGDTVSEGQAIAQVEAMKATHDIICQSSGVVVKVHVKIGQEVDSSTPLLTIRK